MCGTKDMCPEEEVCPLCNTVRFSLKMYDACQPLRDIIAEFPELRGPIVEALGKGMTQVFAGDFYGGMKP